MHIQEIPDNPLAYGNDSAPLMASVPEPPPSHWGKLTSRKRTDSVSYLLFLEKHKRKEAQDNGRGKLR
jgi:hypothetical protein